MAVMSVGYNSKLDPGNPVANGNLYPGKLDPRACNKYIGCKSAPYSDGSSSSSRSSSSSSPSNSSPSSMPIVTAVAPSPASNSSASSSPTVTAVAPSPASNSSASSSPTVTAVAPSPASNSLASSSPDDTAVAPSPAGNSSPIPLSLSSPGISSGAVAIFTSFAVVGGVALIVLAVLIIKYIRKKKLKTTSADVESAQLNSIVSTESFLDEISKEEPTSFTPQHLQVFTRNNLERLGGGGFGVVYKGEFPDGTPFAVKILNKDLGKRVEEQFIAEVNTLSRTNHANLVRLHGYCSDPEVKALVYEYMDNGSLDGYLDGQKAKIEWGKLYEIAVGTAEGIRYLHEECEKKIIHYDIKPANILLSKDFSPKVADFGLAEIFDRENTISTITGGKGTPGFVAPEVWETAVLTCKSDVYSFGKVLFEMLWTTWNSEFKQAESKVGFTEWVREKVERNELESVISNCGDAEDRMKTETMCKVALQCVQRDHKKRPSMSEVVEMLLLWNKKMDARSVYPFNSIVPIDADSEIVK